MNFPWLAEPIEKLPYVILDLETTGISPYHSKIIEIAVASLWGDESEVWTTLIDPEVPIPPEVTRINGITNEMVAGKPKIGEVIHKVYDKLRGQIFVSHNVPFDWSFIAVAVRQYCCETLQLPHMCTLHLSKRYLKLTSHSLSSVSAFLGVPLKNAHRAVSDTLAVRGLLRWFLNELKKSGVTSGYDLMNLGLLKMTPPS